MPDTFHSTDFITISKHENCDVRLNKKNNKNGLFSNEVFKTGDSIVAFKSELSILILIFLYTNF